MITSNIFFIVCIIHITLLLQEDYDLLVNKLELVTNDAVVKTCLQKIEVISDMSYSA